MQNPFIYKAGHVSQIILAFKNASIGKFLLYLFSVFMYFPMIFTNIISIFLLVYCFLKFKRADFIHLLKDKYVVIMLLFFFILVLGFLYDIPREGVLNNLEKKLSFIIFPLVVGLIGIEKKDFRRICALFFYTGILITTIAFLMILLAPIEIIGFKSFINHELSNQINLHATYLSMYLLFSLVYPVLFIDSIKSRNVKNFNLVLTLLCVIYILFLGVRIIWLILFFLLLLRGFQIIRESENTKRKIFIFAMIISTLPTFIFVVKPLRERAKELVNYNNEYNIKEVWGGRGIRLMIWQSGLELLKNKPLVGYGSSTAVQAELNNVYKTNKLGPLLYLMEKNKESFNPHNQFLSEVLKHGLFLGLYYPFVIFFLAKKYNHKRSLIGFVFLSIIFCVSLTETILELNKGIIFFSFFGAIIYFNRNIKENTNKLSPVK